MSIEKDLLKRLTLLYVEDDKHIRTELSALLSNFFQHIYTANDGAQGLETYLKNQDSIDIIISDINMPKLSGITMLQKIREIDATVPIIFATAYSDNEFLSEAIKLKVYDYIVKPVDIRHLLSVINELARVLYNEFLIKQKNAELEKYKEIINANNIVIKTDTSGIITYVNEHFCNVTGYKKEAIVNKHFDTIVHPNTDSSLINQMFSDVLDNKAWKGQLKNSTRLGEAYHVDCYCIAILNDAGEITGTFSIHKDITMELQQRREVKVALMKDKGEIFLKGKESITELNTIITELNTRINDLQKILKNSELEKDKIIYESKKYAMENQRLILEIAQYKKDPDVSHQVLKLNKTNSDLKQEVNRVKIQHQQQFDLMQKDFMQERINLEVKIDDLEKELSDYKNKMDDIIDAETYTQKLNYWKEKAKDESKRAETLEKKIMQYGDQGILNKLFGGRNRS